jgi:hypothetical protein
MRIDSDERERLEGFPLSSREREALDAFAGALAPCPKGVGGATLTNLHSSRRWIERAGRSEEPKIINAALYALTPSGRLAIEIDDYFISLGYSRRGPKYESAGLKRL